MLNERITQGNSGWGAAQEISMCILLLKAVPAWGQTRWLRALSSQILKASKNGNFTALLAACSTAWVSSWGNSFSYTQYESLLYSLCLLSLILPPLSVKSLALSFRAFTVTRLFLPRWRVYIDSYWILYGSCWLFKVPLNGWSTLKLQTDSTWKLLSPENLTKAWSIPSSRSPVKVTNRTGPRTDARVLHLLHAYECAWDKRAKSSSSLSSLSIYSVLCPFRM